MEGRGVTNYDSNKPSYGFSTTTTEFDDALLSRGIITYEQAMIAKGASALEAHRLTNLRAKEHEDRKISNEIVARDANCLMEHKCDNFSRKSIDDDDDEDDDDDNDDDDDDFLKQYRKMRINEMKAGYSSSCRHTYGDMLYISRPDWFREVNHASKDGLWVVVNLSRNSTLLNRKHDEMCDAVEEIMKDLAHQYEDIKFVSIPSTAAIENWPSRNLPSVFCYRFGKLQFQLIGIDALGGPGVNCGRVEWRLAKLGVLKSELIQDPKPNHEVMNSACSGAFHPHFSQHTSNQHETSVDLNIDYDGVD